MVFCRGWFVWTLLGNWSAVLLVRARGQRGLLLWYSGHDPWGTKANPWSAAKLLIYRMQAAATTMEHINSVEIADSSMASFVLTSWRLIVTLRFPLCSLLTVNLLLLIQDNAFVLAMSGQRLFEVCGLIRVQSWTEEYGDVPTSIKSGPQPPPITQSKSEWLLWRRMHLTISCLKWVPDERVGKLSLILRRLEADSQGMCRQPRSEKKRLWYIKIQVLLFTSLRLSIHQTYICILCTVFCLLP